MQEYRTHQAELVSKLQKVGQQDLPLSILAYVVPGGGKSWLPGLVARRFPGMKIAWFVPRLSLQNQAAAGTLKDFGLRLWESKNEPNPSRGEAGFVATHQGLTAQPDLYLDELKRHPYILVTDEIHHAKIGRDGEPNQLASILSRLAPLARVHLMMSGTLETNDGTFIWGVDYDQIKTGYVAVPERSANIFIRYERQTALSENAIVPIEFYHHDGPVSYINGSGIKDRILSLASNRKEESEVIFTALRTEIADELLSRGVQHWKQHGRKLAVICENQYSAKRFHKMLVKQSLGTEVGLAVTDEGPEAAETIKRYKTDSCNVVVSCGMVYEGHDNPPITHIVCLTHIRSVPWIEQMLARAWRSFPDKTKCWAFVPDDPRMNRVIDLIRIERPATVGFVGQGNEAKKQDGEDGEEPTSVIAIRSAVDAVRAELLDGDFTEAVVRAKAVEMLVSLGIPETHPLVGQIVAASLASSLAPISPVVELTPSEKAMRLRKNIWSQCNAKDHKDGLDPGTSQKELTRRTGVIFKTATLEELERVAIVCANLCA